MAAVNGRAEKASLAVLVASFLSASLVMIVGAQFPVNDDWTQAVAVRETLDAGAIYYPSWLSAFSYVQIAYGVVLSALFGFSYPLLRATTVALASASTITVFLLARRRGLGTFASISAAALLVVNPIFFFTACTFQTDIPALFFISFAFLWYEIGLGSRSISALVLGSVAASAALLTRQIGALVVVSGVVVAWIERVTRDRRLLLAILSPVVLAVSMVLLARLNGFVQGEVGTHLLPINRGLLGSVLTNVWHCFLLFSLFVLPVSVSVSIGNPRWFLRKSLLIALAIAFVAASVAVIRGESIGALGNVLTPYGFGPTMSVLQGELAPTFPSDGLVSVTWLLSLGGAIWIFAFIQARTGRVDWQRGALALLVFSAAYLPVIIFVHPFDRYLLPLFPLVAHASAIVLQKSSHSKISFIVVSAALFVFSIVGTRDAFAWRAALWRLGDRVEISGVPIELIEGGYEWDGDRLYAEADRRPLANRTPTWAPWYVRDLFPGHGMDVILSFSPLGGYGIMDKEKVVGILGDRTIYANMIRPGSLHGARGEE